MVFKRENISVVLVGFCMVLIGVINWSSMYGGKRRPRDARTKWVFLTLKAENSCKRSLIKSGIFSPSSANSVGWEKSELPDLFWVFLFGLWWKCWTLSLTRALRGVGVNPSEGLGCTHTAEFHHHSPLWAGISHFSISSIAFAAPGVTWNMQEFRERARTEPGCCRTENPSAGAAKDNHHEWEALGHCLEIGDGRFFSCLHQPNVSFWLPSSPLEQLTTCSRVSQRQKEWNRTKISTPETYFA